MKNFLVFFLMIGMLTNLQAQDKEAHHKKIKSLKTAYITQELNMDSELAQKFWPIYNAYEARKKELHEREHVKIEDLSSLTESKANAMLREYLEIEKQEYLIKKQLFADLKDIISAKDIIKLHKLEYNFNKKLLREYKERRAREKQREEEEEDE